ncbi:ABC transporter permease [Demequina sp. NBRC 110052]|uniref:ABC transporter permease n=1 Tax=Demequina sp. NBRC 110052 TaxID=1570341 RepID=UPI0009FE7E22|nr:ABC transporter permease [Demequina sp. NBRC 110052]
MKRIPVVLFTFSGVLAGIATGLVLTSAEVAFPAPASIEFGYSDTAFVAVLIAGLFAAFVAGVLGYALRVVGLRHEAAQWRVEMSLGAVREDLVHAQTWQGARHGALAGAGGVTVGLAGVLMLPASSVPSENPFGAWMLALVHGFTLVAITAVAGSLAYQAAAQRLTAPGRASAPTLLEPPEEDSPQSPRVTLILAMMGAAGLGVLSFHRLAPLTAPEDPSSGAGLVVAVAGGLALVAAYSLLPRPLGYGVQRAAASAALGVAALLERAGSRPSSGLRLGAQALSRRSRLRTLAAALTTLVIAVVAFASTTSALSDARQRAESPYWTYGVLSTVRWDEALDPGVVASRLPDAVVQAIVDDPRVIAAPAGLIVTSEDDGPIDGTVTVTSAGEAMLVVAPEDLAGVGDTGLRPLGFQDGTVTSRGEGATRVGEADLYRLRSVGLAPLVTRTWAEAAYGDVPVSSVIVWAAEPGQSAEATFAMFDDVFADAGASLDFHVLGSTGGASSGEAGIVGWLFGSPFIMLGVGLVIALAASSARELRREMATLAALGASPRALRAVPMVEAGFGIAAATLVGTVSGAFIATLASHPTLLKPGAPLDLGETLWGWAWQWQHVAWGAPLGIGAVSLALALLVTAAFGSSMARGTPAQEIRLADKEGVR